MVLDIHSLQQTITMWLVVICNDITASLIATKHPESASKKHSCIISLDRK